MNRLVEIRCYTLKPGVGAEFHRLVREESLPLLKEAAIDVLGYGPSLHDEDSYFLIRVYDGLEHMRSSEEVFYGSDAWRLGTREAILGLIESYSSGTLWLSESAIEAMRESLSTPV
jgi:hypothetical protein